MYDTLIAGEGRTLSFPFVVHLQDVWRRVNGAVGLTVNIYPSPEGVSSLKSLLSQITVGGFFL